MIESERKEKKDWLSRYQVSLRKESRLLVQIRLAESRAESTTQNLTGMPGGGASGSKVENGAILLAAYRMDLNQQQAESEKIRAEIEMAIGKIQDENQREVLTWIYIVGELDDKNRPLFHPMGNKDVSERMHYSIEWVKKKKREALDAISLPPITL